MPFISLKAPRMIDRDLIDTRHMIPHRLTRNRSIRLCTIAIRYGDSRRHRSGEKIKGLSDQLQAAVLRNLQRRNISSPNAFGYNVGNYCRV